MYSFLLRRGGFHIRPHFIDIVGETSLPKIDACNSSGRMVSSPTLLEVVSNQKKDLFGGYIGKGPPTVFVILNHYNEYCK